MKNIFGDFRSKTPFLNIEKLDVTKQGSLSPSFRKWARRLLLYRRGEIRRKKVGEKSREREGEKRKGKRGRSRKSYAGNMGNTSHSRGEKEEQGFLTREADQPHKAALYTSCFMLGALL
jgi:hypothetical protein